MSYIGDYRAGDSIFHKFTTRRFSTGAPHQLAGTPAVRVYKDDSTTEDDSGITLTVDFDSRTGLNHVGIDTSADGTFYAAGADYDVVITAGTVDSVSVVGEVIFSFSIDNRSALRPTTAGRTLDVSAGGEAGVDWNNVGTANATVNLSATTVKTATDVETDTADIQSRLPAALTAGGNMKSDVLALNGVTASASKLERSASTIVTGTVDAGAHTPTTTEFEADDITTAAADFYIGRIILFTSGALAGHASDITDYAKVGSNGHFTVTALVAAPADNVTFCLV